MSNRPRLTPFQKLVSKHSSDPNINLTTRRTIVLKSPSTDMDSAVPSAWAADAPSYRMQPHYHRPFTQPANCQDLDIVTATLELLRRHNHRGCCEHGGNPDCRDL